MGVEGFMGLGVGARLCVCMLSCVRACVCVCMKIRADVCSRGGLMVDLVKAVSVSAALRGQA